MAFIGARRAGRIVESHGLFQGGQSLLMRKTGHDLHQCEFQRREPPLVNQNTRGLTCVIPLDGHAGIGRFGVAADTGEL